MQSLIYRMHWVKHAKTICSSAWKWIKIYMHDCVVANTPCPALTYKHEYLLAWTHTHTCIYSNLSNHIVNQTLPAQAKFNCLSQSEVCLLLNVITMLHSWNKLWNTPFWVTLPALKGHFWHFFSLAFHYPVRLETRQTVVLSCHGWPKKALIFLIMKIMTLWTKFALVGGSVQISALILH